MASHPCDVAARRLLQRAANRLSSITTDRNVGIGQGAGTTGTYTMTGGTFSGGAAEFRVGSTNGTGTLSLSGSASFTHTGNFFLAHQGNTTASGTLELVGSSANFNVAKLQNAPGTNNNETIRWIADATGITPLVVAGTFGGSDFVQLQNSAEIAANTGGAGSLMGNGIALELNLAALSGNMSLLIIDNQSSESIKGFFENGTTMDLYEEGEAILGTGYSGTVNISYMGGVGTNDVVLTLVAGGLPGDYNNDGKVNAADYVLWRKNPGGIYTADDYNTCRTAPIDSARYASSSNVAAVPSTRSSF